MAHPSRSSCSARRPVRAGLLAASLLASVTAWAQPSPVGLWQVFDDTTKQPESLVRISESGGVLTGQVEKLLDPAAQAAKCDKCSDERKGQPVLGMTILRNVKAKGDGTWDGGEILDPDDGKTYRVRLRPFDGGRKLEVRGFIGVFYRNQQWQRVE